MEYPTPFSSLNPSKARKSSMLCMRITIRSRSRGQLDISMEMTSSPRFCRVWKQPYFTTSYTEHLRCRHLRSECMGRVFGIGIGWQSVPGLVFWSMVFLGKSNIFKVWLTHTLPRTVPWIDVSNRAKSAMRTCDTPRVPCRTMDLDSPTAVLGLDVTTSSCSSYLPHSCATICL